MSERETGEGEGIRQGAQAATPASAASELRTPRLVSSDALLRGDSQLAILHEQTLYYLRRTRFGKLILTK